MKELEKYAEENNIPIMQKDGIEFLLDFISKNNIKNILEIGSAIGYSAIRMALINKDIKVTTIERDKERYNEAIKNIKNYNLKKQITIINDDAFNVNLDEKYDLIFIDAAKSQYIKFFEKFKLNLKEDGYIVSDNLNFHGLTQSDPKILSRNVRGLVRKLNSYVEFLKNNSEFETNFYNLGDGVSISRRKEVVMKKNAFTLIELLGVIVILVAVALIAFPPLLNQIQEAQNRLDKATTELVVNSAQSYLVANHSLYPKKNLVPYCIEIQDLINDGYLTDGMLGENKEKALTKIVKVTYEAENEDYSYDVVDNDKCYTCIAATSETRTTGNIPTGEYNAGDEYLCEVKPGEVYNFFVLNSDNDETVNLLMDRNIGSDGTPVSTYASSSIKWWVSEVDIKSATGLASVPGGNLNHYGPITVLNYLQETTKDWVNIPNIDMNYRDEGNTNRYGYGHGYGSIVALNGAATVTKSDGTVVKTYENLKARLPYGYERTNFDGTNLWMFNYLNQSSNVTGDGLKNVSGLHGYWTAATNPWSNSWVYYVSYEGSHDGNKGNIGATLDRGQNLRDTFVGVRPVINVIKSQIKNN